MFCCWRIALSNWLRRTAHANDGASSFSALARVRLLLNFIFGPMDGFGMVEVARPKLCGPPAGVWRFERERPARWWRNYSCVAVASDGEDEFRLVCEWSQPLYILTVTSRGRGPDDPVFDRFHFTDEDCGDVVRRVMRIARRDVARRLARLDQLHRDAVIGASRVCVGRERSRPAPGSAVDGSA